jgi:dimethylglycine dehydrogenase
VVRQDARAEDTNGFTRQNWWGPVGDEARMLREARASSTSPTFAKYRVQGPGAEDWLNAVFANPCRARWAGPA